MGQVVCLDRQDIVARLAQKYQEAPVWYGAVKGNMLELLTDPDGGTWSMLLSMPNGTSCMISSGEGWRDVERAVEGPET